jgi:outer membrane protein OmpA-like peptidoglycan-associated protein/osmotically-inducible protein OsmY
MKREPTINSLFWLKFLQGKQMKKILLIILGLIAIIALSYGCFFMKKDLIKEDLLSKAQSTYKINQMDWVHPTIKGENLEITRVLQLSGNAPSQEAKDEAEKVASTIEGLNGIDNQITIPIDNKKPIQKSDINELAQSIVDQESQIDPMKEDIQLVSSDSNLQNEDEINSDIESSTQEQEIEEKPTTDIIKPSPYIFSAIKNENGNLLLNGFIGNQEEYDNVLLLAKKLFEEGKIKNDLKVVSGNPKGWSEMILLSINKLHDIDYGDIKITDSSYIFNAHVSSDKEKKAFLDDIKAKLSTPNNQYIRYQGDYIITAPVPIQQIENHSDNIKNRDTKAQNSEQEKEAHNQSNLSCQKEFNALLKNEKIQFRYNKSIIKKDSYSLLNSLARVAKKCKNAKIVIGGYTDSIGSKAYNKNLSRKRANRVKNYLIRRGVSKNNLKAIGYGESNPIADNFHEAGRAKNRRIEFKIEGVEK